MDGLRLYYSFVKTDGTMLTPALNLLTTATFTLTKQNALDYIGVYFELRLYTGNSFRMCDYETVEIAKTENGKSITKKSEVSKYMVSADGVTTPSGTWQNTKAGAISAYNTAHGISGSEWQKDTWMWTQTTITWSDDSTTVLYTNERNPNDGVPGQDIIVDGATEMKYYVGTSNSSHPAENSSDWKDLSQVTQTQGKWLWSKATTYYRKAGSAAGSHDAGYSVNYNVSYISKDGGAGRGITSVTEYYKATNSSSPMSAPTSDSGWSTDPNLSDLTDKWDANHKYLWNYEKVTYSSGTTVERTVPQILAIWTKDGRGIDSIQNKYKVTNSASVPLREHEGGSGWDDNPITPGQGQYLWNYEVISWTDSSEPTYTDVQLIGYVGKDGPEGPAGNDGYTVMVEPANLIFTQSTTKVNGSYPLEVSSKTSTVTVKKGNSNSAVSHTVSIASYSGCISASASGDVITVNGQIGEYTEGYVYIQVAITNGPTFTLKLNLFYNLLGTWKQWVEAGTENIVAEKISYIVHNGDNSQTIEKCKQTFNSVRNAAGAFENWLTDSENDSGSYLNMQKHIRNAEQNITNISASIRKNLLDCADGSGWRYWSGGDLCDYEKTTGRILPKGNEDAVDAYSTAVWLKSGVTYVFSVYAPSTPAVMFCKVNGPDVKPSSGSNISVTASSGRYYGTFTPSTEGYYKINVFDNYEELYYFYHPQLEVGSTPTDFESSSRNYSSEIRQTAEEIALDVQTDIEGKLSNVGIRIDGTNRTINLTAGKVNFKKTDNSTNDNITIDPETGSLKTKNLEAENGVFTGSLLFHKVKVSAAGISEQGQKLFTMYGSDGLEIPISNTTKTVAKVVLDCDIFILTGSKRSYTVYLPPAKLFKGARIKIVNGTYSGGNGTAKSVNPSQITLAVVYRSSTENPQDDAYGYAKNNFTAGIPFTFASGSTDVTLVGAPDTSKLTTLSYDAYGLMMSNNSLYKTIELVSTLNREAGDGTSYAWMIVDAKI